MWFGWYRGWWSGESPVGLVGKMYSRWMSCRRFRRKSLIVLVASSAYDRGIDILMLSSKCHLELYVVVPLFVMRGCSVGHLA